MITYGLTRSSDSTLLYSSQRGYDAVGNVTGVLTTLPAGTDRQTFCYDAQNRLVWASSGNFGGPCGSNVAGSLSSAFYDEIDRYDTLDRLTNGPLGSYTYGDAAHLHAVTAIGPTGAPTYTARYDAAGNLTCRAPDATTTCAGTPTGATLAFDTEGRLASWTGGTVTDSFLYDGAGNRVAQQVIVNGTSTTTTTYVDGGQEEIATTGGSSTLTKYFPGVGGLPTAERIGTNGALAYLASDGQGSVSAALDANGAVTFQQLYTPYGSVRYSSGASPTAFGYTGQRADAATGLDYYQARYYDPVAQQFVSADSANAGQNRYGYVSGNPATNTDPSGHRLCAFNDPSSCGKYGPGTSPDPSGNPSTHTHDCKTDLEDTSNTCAKYRDWETRMKHKRWDALTVQRIAAGVLMMGAIAVDIAVDVYVIWNDQSLMQKLLALVDLLSILIYNVAPAISLFTSTADTYSANPDWANSVIVVGNGAIAGVLFVLVKLARVAQQTIGLVRRLITVVKQLGPFGEGFVSGAIEAIKDGLGGPMTLFVKLLMEVAGSAIFVLAEAGSHAAFAAAYAAKGWFDHQVNMDIGAWCAQNSGKCEQTPQRYDTVTS